MRKLAGQHLLAALHRELFADDLPRAYHDDHAHAEEEDHRKDENPALPPKQRLGRPGLRHLVDDQGPRRLSQPRMSPASVCPRAEFGRFLPERMNKSGRP